jgi:hypothetical protein
MHFRFNPTFYTLIIIKRTLKFTFFVKPPKQKSLLRYLAKHLKKKIIYLRHQVLTFNQKKKGSFNSIAVRIMVKKVEER